MHGLISDVRQSLRSLTHSPGFTSIVVLTIAIGIAVNTAVFSLVDSALFRPLPFDDPKELVIIWQFNEQFGAYLTNQAEDIVNWRSNLTSFSHLESHQGVSLELSGGERPIRIDGARVSPTLFDCLKVQPIRGRLFTEDDAIARQGRVAMISRRLWKRQIAGADDIVGTTIRLDGEDHVVIGVLPDRCRYPRNSSEIWVPLDLESAAQSASLSSFDVIARLKSGTTLAQAQSELDAVGTVAPIDPSMGEWAPKIVSASKTGTGSLLTWMILIGAVGFVFLSVCASVAGMMLARGLTRQREMALQLSLGAGHLRLLRRNLIESLLLATLGGVLGLLLALWMADLFTTLTPKNYYVPVKAIHVDGPLVLCVMGLVLLTTLLCGLAPALQAMRIPPLQTLRQGAAGSGISRTSLRTRHALLVVQIATCFVLVIGAGLLSRSLVEMIQAPAGFNPSRLLAMKLDLPDRRFDSNQQKHQFVQDLGELIAARPEFSKVTLADGVPMHHWMKFGAPRIDNRPPQAGDEQMQVYCARVDEDYFDVLGISLLEGRPFAPEEIAGDEPVVIISEKLARHLWPDESPIGGRLEKDSWYTVIGVVSDIRQSNPLSPRPDSQMYFPLNATPSSTLSSVWIVGRTEADPKTVMGTMRSSVWSIDPDQPITQIGTLEHMYGETVAQPRFTLILLGSVAGVAMLLMAIGVFGVTAFAVARQTREIGIRAALGARADLIVRSLVGRGMLMSLIGILIGGVLSLGLTHLMSHLLFNVSTLDPMTYIVTAGMLLLVTGLACYFPARRAARIDPMIALRQE